MERQLYSVGALSLFISLCAIIIVIIPNGMVPYLGISIPVTKRIYSLFLFGLFSSTSMSLFVLVALFLPIRVVLDSL